VTPRLNTLPENTSSGVYVFKDGQVVSGRGEKIPKLGFRDTRLDPDDLARHERLVRRQHFMDRE